MTHDRNPLTDAARFLDALSAEFAYAADYLITTEPNPDQYNAIARRAAKLATALRAHRCTEP